MNIVKRIAINIPALLLFLGIAFVSYGQDRELKGKIISASTRGALPYADIKIPGKGITSISNEDGLFVFKFPADNSVQDSIIFSCIGYKPLEISIDDALKQQHLVVSLIPSVLELQEVIIKPLTLKQLIDSISHRNYSAFNSPMKLDGYYREFVFTNAKCTEYADALFTYYYDQHLKSNGQLKIAASRCEKAVQKYDNSKNFEANLDSRMNPDKMFDYAMLFDLVKEHFAGKLLDDYSYTIEDNAGDKDLRITIFPKTGSDKAYKLQFLLSADFSLKWYKLEIPAGLLSIVKERSMLGIHSRITDFAIEVQYNTNNGGVYPEYFRLVKDLKIYGKFLGVVLNQVTEQKSEFIVTRITTKDVTPIPKNEIYKKGNICGNGIAINTALLKNYNFILPTKKDSLTIKSITTDSLAN